MIIDTVLVIAAAFIALPLLIVGTQCLIALFITLREPQSIDQPVAPCSYKILVPAHNEAKIIGKTLGRLVDQLPEPKPENIILIADNCSDNTAEIARSYGVTVLERHNQADRGKGFALDFGIQHLKKPANFSGIVVILDADCETTKLSLITLISTAQNKKLPAQMVYLMRTGGKSSIKQKIAGFAWMLKNKIRLMAMNALNLPVILTGTGMAFPWNALETVRLGNANIVEDMQLGIDCSIGGFPPVPVSQYPDLQ